MPLTDSQILQLVAGGETLTVDFKREGYNLSNEKTKIECLKDILAIANVLAKDEKGYIVTGISLVSARPSFVGITKGEADDANFQQHINKKTNRSVRFLYSEINVRRKLIGIFEIQGSGRPIFLLKDFMSMKATDVPIRKGTSTAIATPDEIYRMALEDSGIDAVGCELFFYNELLDEDSAGSEISISSNARMAKKPRAKESNEQFLAEMMSRAMRKVFGNHPIMICFKNVGSKALENVVIIIKISRDDQIEIESDREFKEESKAPSHETPILKTVNSRTVELRWIIERAVPQLLIKLEPFFVRTANVTDIELTARIYANSLADPVSKDLRVKINQKK